jgi:hypothetical protein
MTSEARIAANRRNAALSTGPKTPQGKARSRQNSWKHGLSTSIGMDPTWADGTDELADAIWQASAEPHIKKNPHLAAALTMDVVRAGNAKAALLNLALVRMSAVSALADPLPAPDVTAEQEAKAFVELLGDLVRLQRYEDRTEARYRRIFGW